MNEQISGGRKVFRVICCIIAFAQAAASIFFMYRIFRLNMLPAKYEAAAFVVLALLFVISAFLLIKKWKGIAANIIGIILAAAVCFASIFGSNVLGQVTGTLDTITDTTTKINAMVGVYVLTDDPAQSIEDAKDYSFGIMTDFDTENTAYAVQYIESEVAQEIETIEASGVTDVMDNLLNGEVQAIIINESYIGAMEETEEYANFEDQARLLYEVAVETEVENADETEDSNESESVADITKDPFVIYISGSDTRSAILDTSRSDVNILMVVNPSTKEILLLNTPRDYYVANPAGGGAMDKLTHCGIYGVDTSIAALENLYGCDINYYAQINFTGFETLIDALGGVTVNASEDFSTGTYSFTQGANEVDGAKALAFARERYAFASGDNQRGKNQMEVIRAVIAKATSSTAVLSNYSEILSSLENMFVTDLESDEISSLVKMQLSDMDSWNVSSYAVTGAGGMEKTYSMPKLNAYVMYQDADMVSKAANLIDKVESGDSLTEADLQ